MGQHDGCDVSYSSVKDISFERTLSTPDELWIIRIIMGSL